MLLFSILDELCFGERQFDTFSENSLLETLRLKQIVMSFLEQILSKPLTWIFHNLRTELSAARTSCTQVPGTDPVSLQN